MRTRLTIRHQAAAAVFAASAVLALNSRADVFDTTWLGGAGSWNDPTKWSGGVVPNNTAETTFRAFIPTGSATVAGGTITIDAVNVGAAATLTANSLGFNVSQSEINGAFVVRRQHVKSGPLTGSGSISVGIVPDAARLEGLNVLDIGSGLTATLRRYSGIGGSVPFINRGFVSGGDTDSTFAPFIACSSIQNLGTIEAKNGMLLIGAGGTYTRDDLGTLVWNSGTFTIQGTLLNQNRILQVDASHGWGMLAATIRGGTVEIAANAPLVIGGEFAPGSALENVVVNGPIRLINNDLDVVDGTLAGNADVLMTTGFPGRPSRLMTSAATLAIATTATVRTDIASAGIGDGNDAIVNHGVIRAQGLAFNNARLTILGTSVFSDGTIRIDPRSRIDIGRSNLPACDLTLGAGAILRFDGFGPEGLAPFSIGTMTVTGQLDLSSASDSLVLTGLHGAPMVFQRIISTGGGVVGEFDVIPPSHEVEYRTNHTEIWARFVPEPAAAFVLIPTTMIALRKRRRALAVTESARPSS